MRQRTGSVVVSLKQGKASANGKDVGILSQDHLVSRREGTVKNWIIILENIS